MVFQEKGYAKINLALHVTGSRSDGYHSLDSLVVFSNFGDNLMIKETEEESLVINGRFAQPLDLKRNSILDMLSLFEGKLTNKFSIFLEKNIPVGGGLGGGSADAAALIRFLANQYKVEVPSFEKIAKFGADIPACFYSKALRMQGIGEIITRINFEKIDLWVVLVHPNVNVSTRTIFESLHKKQNQPLERYGDLNNNNTLIQYLRRQRNDLEHIACKKHPEIEVALNALMQTRENLIARMSGSGSTCFGLYENENFASHAAKRIKEQRKNWWVKYSKII